MLPVPGDDRERGKHFLSGPLGDVGLVRVTLFSPLREWDDREAYDALFNDETLHEAHRFGAAYVFQYVSENREVYLQVRVKPAGVAHPNAFVKAAQAETVDVWLPNFDRLKMCGGEQGPQQPGVSATPGADVEDGFDRHTSQTVD